MSQIYSVWPLVPQTSNVSQCSFRLSDRFLLPFSLADSFFSLAQQLATNQLISQLNCLCNHSIWYYHYFCNECRRYIQCGLSCHTHYTLVNASYDFLFDFYFLFPGWFFLFVFYFLCLIIFWIRRRRWWRWTWTWTRAGTRTRTLWCFVVLFISTSIRILCILFIVILFLSLFNNTTCVIS